MVMKRAKEKNIKFNADKIQWKTKEVLFLGYRITERGIECDKSRLKGIEDLGPPKSKADLPKTNGIY